MVCPDCLKKLSQLKTENEKNKRLYGNLQVEFDNKYKSGKCLKCGCLSEGMNKYCLLCAHSNGLCEMCGKKLFEKNLYKITDNDRKDFLRKKRSLAKSRELYENYIKEKNLKGVTKKKKVDMDEVLAKRHEELFLKKKQEKEAKEKEKKRFVALESKEDDKKEDVKGSVDKDKKDDLLKQEFDEVINL